MTDFTPAPEHCYPVHFAGFSIDNKILQRDSRSKSMVTSPYLVCSIDFQLHDESCLSFRKRANIDNVSEVRERLGLSKENARSLPACVRPNSITLYDICWITVERSMFSATPVSLETTRVIGTDQLLYKQIMYQPMFIHASRSEAVKLAAKARPTPSEHLCVSQSKRWTLFKVSKNRNTHSDSDSGANSLKHIWMSFRKERCKNMQYLADYR